MKKNCLKILLLLFLLMGIGNVYAKPYTYERNESNNYGVNKKWSITENNLPNVLDTPLVDAKEKIIDFDDVLTDSEEEELTKLIKKFIEKTNMDMVIVIPNFPYSNDSENEDYAADFYDYNDYGLDFEKYSGVLFLRNHYDADPFFNIYTFGYAQLFFSYNRLENLLDDIYPDIKSENYVKGFTTFINTMIDYYDRGIPREMRNYYVDDMGYLKQSNSKAYPDFKYEERQFQPSWLIYLLISLGITAIIMGILIKKNKMVVKVKTAGEYLNKNSVNINNRKDVFVSSHTSSYTTSSSSGGGGFSSHGGSSGGGHSGGGGRHG